MDIFSTTITAIEAAKWALEKAEKAAKADEEVRKLINRLETSKGVLEEARQLYKLPSKADEQEWLNVNIDSAIEGACSMYKRVLDYLKDDLQADTEARGVRNTIIRRWKGVKWVINESWVRGRIDEIEEQDKIIQNMLQILVATDSHETKLAQKHVQDTLRKVQNSMDVSRFLDTINLLPTDLEKSPMSILEHAQQSLPSWVLNESAFREWVESTRNTPNDWLWVLGDAGTGKTYIATYLARRLQDLDLFDRPLSNDEVTSDESQDLTKERSAPPASRATPIIATAIYYCSFAAREPQITDHIFRALLHQLMTQLWEAAPRRAYDQVQSIHDLVSYQGVHREMKAVHSVLDKVSRSFDQVYLVIDALDELPTSNFGDLVQKLITLRSPTLKFLVTSREGMRAHAKRRLAYILNANNNESTIRTFVNRKLKNIADGDDSNEYIGPSALPERIMTENNRKKITDKIVRLASGNFLCAELQIKQLKGEQTPESLDQALENLSGTVDELVKQAIDRVELQPEKYKAQVGKQAILWAVYARGSSIKFLELQHALAFKFYGDKSKAARDFDEQKLAEATCYFLSIERDSDTVSIHKAIKDFCVEAEKGAIYFEDAHSIIARTCLGCLSMSRKDSRNREEWENAVEESPLLGYAAKNWGWHMAKAHELLPTSPFPNLDIMDLLGEDRFLDTVTVAIQPKLRELGVWQDEMWNTLRTKKPPISVIHILAFFNLPQTAKKWLSSGENPEGFISTSDSRDGYSALYLASILGNHEIVRILMKRGADPTRKNGPEGVTALQSAVMLGHVEVVDTLLEVASEEVSERMVVQKDARGLLPLANACGHIHNAGNIEIVCRLLKVMETMSNRSDLILTRGGPLGHSVLHRAAESDNADIIDALLHFPGGEQLLELPSTKMRDTPLTRAAWASWKNASNSIKYLLDAGANPRARQKDGSTAAHAAAHHEGHMNIERTECLELLLPRSDLSIKDNKGRTVLHSASGAGRPHHVAAILRYLSRRRELIFTTDDEGCTAIMTAAKNISLRKLQCIELLIPVMGKEIPINDAQKLRCVLQRHNYARTFSRLLRYFPDPKALVADKSTTLLRQAVLSGHRAIIKAVIERYGTSDLESRGPQGQTLLIEAVALGHSQVVKYLIDQGADISSPGEVGSTTLQWCVKLCNTDITGAIWTRSPALLLPTQDIQNVLNIASARNPVRKLWQEKGLMPALNRPVHEVECLYAVKSGIAVVVGDKKTERRLRATEGFLGRDEGVYLESNAIPNDAKRKDQDWSMWANDHPYDQGTYHGSDTWFDIGLKRDGKITTRVEVTRNKLNVGNWTTYHVIWDVEKGCQPNTPSTTGWSRFLGPREAQSFMASLRPGDKGWECWISKAEVKAWYED
ncbi:MAG: hypothetical protein M1834_007114 [Cirrosporium novae-zelandiae]|nr:MAG: hypothetical protein M1834_007114 [Cirrosporium novae-zelandiae]